MRFLLFPILLILTSAISSSQDEPVAHPQPPAVTADGKKREALTGILVRQETLRKSVEEKRKIASNESLTDFERSEAAQEIAELQIKIQNLGKEFVNIATGIDIEQLGNEDDQAINLNEELKEVLRPIIQELRDITAAPRETEDLKSQIELLKGQLKLLKEAKIALEETIAPSNPVSLNEALQSRLADLGIKSQTLEIELGIAEAKLAEREANTPTFFTSVSQMVQEFFRTRGAHLLLAILAAGLMALLIRLLYRAVMKLLTKKANRGENFTGRLLHLIYIVTSILGALIAFIITLYLTNDWLLLALTLLFLFGVAWTGKQAVPRFFEQAKMILNLGTVRQGERIIFQGIPWEVQKINFYTSLKNPSLEGGLVRLPMSDLMPLHSRPNGPHELWFPTQEDDWIILTDGTFGKVIQQTPDYVHLVKLGGSRKVIPTSDFLELHPENISKNFRITVTFGIDYRHQSIAADEVPMILQATVQRALLEKVEKDQLLSLQVFFTAAAASSLDYRIVADFNGDLAPRLNAFKDLIQATCVETCNKHNWIIPFTQITIHQAETPSDIPQDESLAIPKLP